MSLLHRRVLPSRGGVNPANFHQLLVYFAVFLIIDFITSTIAFALERQQPGEQGRLRWLLFHIWLQRFAYRQLFSLVLFKTLKRAIERQAVRLGQAGTHGQRQAASHGGPRDTVAGP